jgi:REP element-mobilizing transposase RayT
MSRNKWNLFWFDSTLARHYLPALSAEHLTRYQSGENKLDDFHQLGRGTEGELWKGRFFDRVLRTVKEYTETVEYIHLNPVRRGLVRRAGAEDWAWSSAREYAAMSPEEQERRCGLTVDRVRLPADENTAI